MEERRRLGLLVPSSDIVMEADLWRRLPPSASLHVARMYMESTTVAGEEKMLRDELIPAARRLGSVKPEFVIFGCTSAAALHGLEGDAEIAHRVAETTDSRCVTVVQAVVNEIRKVNVQHLLLVTPYVAEITSRLRETLIEAGLPVVGAEGLGLDSDLDIGAVPPEEIKEFVSRAVKRADTPVDSIFISCTTFRAFDVAESLQKELGIPIFTSNRSAYREILQFLGNEK